MKNKAYFVCLAVPVFASLCETVRAQGVVDELIQWTRGTVGQAAEEKTIAYFRIDGPLVETPTGIPPLMGNKPPLSLKELVERLKEARQDQNVVAVVLDVQQAALGMAQLEELHQALSKFSAVDKDVFVHADSLTTGTYAAATGATNISIVPTGDLWLTGLYGEAPYLRGMLDKIGVVPDMEHCGDFKTGAESITRTGPSEQSKQMSKWLLDGLFGSLVDRMAKSRRVSPQKMRSLIDNGPYSAEEALAAGLIDSVKHRRDFISDLKKRFGDSVEIDSEYGASDEQEIPEDFFAMMSWVMEMLNPSPKVYTDPSVALIYVEGVIVPGAATPSLFGSSSGAYSTTIRKALEKAAEDDSVKAVALRVDSPGGSALASEIIWDATKRVSAKKPFVVSMGNVAGSGGYYVACGAETIFADANTITASIGVLGGKLVTTGGWEKLGINWHAQERGEMAGIMSSAAPFSEKERAKIRHYMETVYSVFKQHVVDGRKGRLTKPIDEMAGGRVFTGAQALELGLVDQIGGLEDAVKFAASRVGLSDYEIRVIPEPPSLFDIFGRQPDDDVAESNVRLDGSWLKARVMDELLSARIARIDPARFQAVSQLLQGLGLLNQERVIALMPAQLLFR